MKRRYFGSTRKLPSGRWQASYWHEGARHIAPAPFKTKADALAHLANIETDLGRGGWINPAAGKVTLAKYTTDWIGDVVRLIAARPKREAAVMNG